MITAPTIVFSNRTPRAVVDELKGEVVEFSSVQGDAHETRESRQEERSANELVISLHNEPTFTRDVNEAAVTIARWEGVVSSVNEELGTMTVVLRSKGGSEPDHTCDILLSSVSTDDEDLIEPGAVFYLEQTKRHFRKTLTLLQSLSFRRLPAWSVTTIKAMEESGSRLRKRFREPTLVASNDIG